MAPSRAAAAAVLLAWPAVYAAPQSIPEIDVSPMLAESADAAAERRVSDLIAAACRDVGFFTLVGHGIPPEVFQTISRRGHEFFALSDEAKMGLAPRRWNAASRTQYRGYFPRSANGKQGLDLGNFLPEAVTAYDEGRYTRHPPLEEETALPSDDALPAGWRADVEHYYRLMTRMGRLVLRAVALYWGHEGGLLQEALIPEEGRPTLSTLRFNLYPASTIEEALETYKLRADENASQPLACDTHTDGAVLTFLYQAEVGGLQVEALDEAGRRRWLDVPVTPNALVVNTGIGMQRLVNGLWNATNHRVLWTGQERLSVPFFFEPHFDAPLTPLPNAVKASAGGAARYPPVQYGAYLVENNKRHREYARGDAAAEGSAEFVRRTTAFILDAQFGALPPEVVREVKRALIDVLGVAAGAQLTDLARSAREVAKQLYGGTGGRLWFDRGEVSAAGAALANALTVDALDMHDSAHNAKGHAGAAVVPAVLAALSLAEGAVSGEELIAALAVGYEVAYRAGEILVSSSSTYYSSGAWNALGAAAAAGRLLRLPREQLLAALGIAEYYSPRGQVMRVMNSPTMLKDGSGWGAHAGVAAAVLAREGFTGAPAELVHRRTDLWSTLGTDWHLLRYHVYKRHGTCYWAQAAVNGAITAREALWPLTATPPEEGVARSFAPGPVPPGELEGVAEVSVQTFPEALGLFQGVPTTTEEAQYGLRFATAAALVHGVVGPSQLTAPGISDPAVRAILNRTRVSVHPRFAKQKLHESQVHENWAEVQVSMTDGRTISSGPMWVEWDKFRGVPEPTDAEIDSKFRWLSAIAGLPKAQADRLLATCRGLEGLADASELVALLADAQTQCDSPSRPRQPRVERAS
eukprot:TRINITY_DN47103_c0_g1_i1.p1 TRINITY_DN47103_c0_g1~~TRINITY_DN47103_c0_g1_i1.p1  ORF type:complete len:890 (+),score=269.38 TRINITY_DN47103_c0_g1_i1:73-2670(+)